MTLWNHRPSKARQTISLIPRHQQSHRRARGFLFCRLSSKIPDSILLVVLSAFLIFCWSLSSDPFPYSITVSEPQHRTEDLSLTSPYWKEQHTENDRNCLAVANHLQTGGRVLLYNFTRPSNGPGMASLTLNLLQIALFMEERWNRTHLVIDEELLQNYRWDGTHGLFGGYLKMTQTCVLSSSTSSAVLLSNATICRFWDVKCPMLEIDANPLGFMFEKARRVTKRYFLQKKALAQQLGGALGDSDESTRQIRLTRFFHDLSRYAFLKLPALQLHPHVYRLVDEHEMFLAPPLQGSVASSLQPPRPLTVETSKGQMDLAFHIRRGDKVAGVRKESRTFDAQEYWDRFVNQFQSVRNLVAAKTDKEYQFKNCFVATDDYQVVSELQVVLQQRPQSPLYDVNDATATTGGQQNEQARIIPCQHLWTLTPPNYTSTWQDRQEILGFLAQMRVLIHAKYFVGSFSSNVGGLVALLRGYQYHKNNENMKQRGRDAGTLSGTMEYTEANRYSHFFDSYAVDWDEWGIL